MTGSWTPSHIAGKYAYIFSGDYAKVTHNSTLDITGSFRLGFQVKFDQKFLTSTLWSKSTGGVTDATITTLNIHSVNGYLRVQISDGTKFLVYDTDERVFATYKAVQIDIVWDQTNKLMKIYKDGVNKAITLNTGGGSFYSSASSIGSLLVTSTADLNFGKGQGQNSYKGKLFGAIFSSRTFSSSEIFDYFNGKQDTVSTPPTGTILYVSDATGQKNIYEMYEDGTNQLLKISSVNELLKPNYNNDKSKISYTDFTNQFIRVKDFNANTDTRISPSFYDSGISPIDNTKLACIYINRTGDGHNRANFANPNVADSFASAISPAHTLASGFDEYLIKYSEDGLNIAVGQSNFSSSYAIYLFDNNLTEASKQLVYSGSNSIDWFTFTPDSQYIIFTQQISGKYQIFKINVNGTGLTQLTAEPNNCKFPTVSPDGTMIAFSIDNGVSSKYQIHTMNIDGTNIINISNNSFSEFASDWK